MNLFKITFLSSCKLINKTNITRQISKGQKYTFYLKFETYNQVKNIKNNLKRQIKVNTLALEIKSCKEGGWVRELMLNIADTDIVV